MKNISVVAYCMVATLAIGAPASAELMLDFGPTTVMGANLTNSPLHAARGGAFTDTTWNKLGTADVSSDLFFSDGALATGVAVNLGSNTALGTIDLSRNPSTSSALGTRHNINVYAGDSVGKDGVFDGSAANIRPVGLQITGLAPGIYDVFVAARNTNTFEAYTMSAHAGAGTPDANFDYSAYASGSVVFPAGSNALTESWVENGNANANYIRLTVTLGEGEALNVAVDSESSGNNTRGFINAIQIAEVPEPSILALLSMGLVALYVFRSRFSR